MWLPLNLPLQFPKTIISSVFPCIQPAINYSSMARRNIRSSTLGLSNLVYLWLIHLPFLYSGLGKKNQHLSGYFDRLSS